MEGVNPRSKSARSRLEQVVNELGPLGGPAGARGRRHLTGPTSLEVEAENEWARLAAELFVDAAWGGTAERCGALAEQGTGCNAALFVYWRTIHPGNA